MIRRTIFCSVAIVAALVSGRPSNAADATTPPDLNGDWKFDAKHSDQPQHQGYGGMGAGMGGHGSWGGHGGSGGHGGWHGGGSGEGPPHGGDPSHSGGGRPPRLPDYMHITQTSTVVSFEDSAGAVLREVATVPAEADTFSRAAGALHVPGRWDKDKLVVEHSGPHDSKVVETLSLKDGGKTLVIDDKIESNGDRPAFEIKRVYTKVTNT